MRQWVMGVGLALSLLASSSFARAAEDEQLLRLAKAKTSLKWNWVPPGRTARYGHAEVLVDAPLAKVRANVTDYAHYRTFSSKFKAARVVDKKGDTTDVYFRIPILKGMGTMSYVLRFGPPRPVGPTSPGVELVEGKFVSGSANVKDVHLSFTLRPVEGARTILSVDLLAVPSFPAPQDAIDEELRDAAMNAVDAIRDQSVRPAEPAPAPPSPPPPTN